MNYGALSTDKWIVRVTEVSIAHKGDPPTRVKINDEGAGEYVTLATDEGGPVGIDPEEWPALRAVIDAMVASCRA